MKAADGGRTEASFQKEFVAYLKRRGWKVRVFTGHAFQTGVPDLFAYHPQYSFRWIDMKREGRYSFTSAQRSKWPEWDADGLGIWIITHASQSEYEKLFQPPNWKDYWKGTWGNVNALIDELREEYARENN